MKFYFFPNVTFYHSWQSVHDPDFRFYPIYFSDGSGVMIDLEDNFEEFIPSIEDSGGELVEDLQKFQIDHPEKFE